MNMFAEHTNEHEIRILELGLRPYREVWDLQRRIVKGLIEGRSPEALILCRHPAVITLGKSAKAENILAEREVLDAMGIEVLEVERGGDVTYHGPGQLVMYPILNLRRRRQDVHWYMRSLEECIIRTLQEFEIIGRRVSGRTGVWTGALESDTSQKPRKIASLGVRISRWCAYHGVSLNVGDCSSGFALINPCGFHDIIVTSMNAELRREVPEGDVQVSLVRNFLEVFEHGSWR